VEIRETGRNAQGVRLINLDDGDTVVDVTRVVSERQEEALTGDMGDGATPEAEADDTT
jgi:DNA gyrase subunit A